MNGVGKRLRAWLWGCAAVAGGMAVAVAVSAAVQSASPADKVLAGAPKTTWVANGKGSRVAYVFFDPNCPSCASLYQSLKAVRDKHDLQVRWIPVAVVNSTSPGKAAAILQAADPKAALARNKDKYQGESYSGGIEEDIPTAETEKRLRQNAELFRELTIPVVPTMLFAGKHGNAIIVQGSLRPSALDKVFAHLP